MKRSIVLASQRAMANDSTVLNKMGNLVLSEVYPSVMSSCIKEVMGGIISSLEPSDVRPPSHSQRTVCLRVEM